MKIDGKNIANKILQKLKAKVAKLQQKNITPNLAIILVGNDPASQAYVHQKDIKAETIGAKTTIINLESEIQNSELIALINKLNHDNSIHGIIVQQPLPSQINVKEITEAIDPKKDVDGFNSKSKFEPPISISVLKILENIYSNTSKAKAQFIKWLKNKKIVVIGKGQTGGKPIIEMFGKMDINPTIIDRKTGNPQNLTKNADIIISAVGKKNVITPRMLKKGAILISIGLHKGADGKLHGDYEESEIKNIASSYTPTPGGIGPINVAMLLQNVTKAASITVIDKKFAI